MIKDSECRPESTLCDKCCNVAAVVNPDGTALCARHASSKTASEDVPTVRESIPSFTKKIENS